MSITKNKIPLTPLMVNLKYVPYYLLQPVRLFKNYNRQDLRPDIMAALTVAVVLLPQAIAYALIAELPPQTGLYAAIVAGIVGALWGSSNHLQNGPTNTVSLLILATLSSTIVTDSPEELAIIAGILAIMVGVLQTVMGLARLGVLVNFVSHSVIVGFASGAGVLIGVKQMRHLFGLPGGGHNLIETIISFVEHFTELNPYTLTLGLATIISIVAFKKLSPKLPGPLISMVTVTALVATLGLDRPEIGVAVIGQLKASFPPLANLSNVLNLEIISKLSTGALAVAAIGLVESMSIASSIASQTRQRLDSNQEFVGQGLCNIFAGLFSGYPCAGSFTRSAVNFKAGAKTPFASIFASLFVLIALFLVAPLAAYLPRTALAGVLIVTAYGMIDQEGMARIARGSRGDAIIMIVTFFATLFLEIEFAVLLGIILSFIVYIMKTSVPKVISILPDYNFKHLVPQDDKRPCPQLGIIDIHGDLYFGAVTHVEQAIQTHMENNPDQHFLLFRMRTVNQCDFSGIHALESIVHAYREKGGDVYMMRIQPAVLAIMKTTGFYDYLGEKNIIDEEENALPYLFYHELDPAICIYECDTRAFRECQNLPKRRYPLEIPLYRDIPDNGTTDITPQTLWQLLQSDSSLVIVDVREPREFKQGHVPQSRLIPLGTLFNGISDLAFDTTLVLVCRSGRRSIRAAYTLKQQGWQNIHILKGGMQAWDAAGLLEGVEI